MFFLADGGNRTRTCVRRGGYESDELPTALSRDVSGAKYAEFRQKQGKLKKMFYFLY
jgi:hypothetical protein